MSFLPVLRAHKYEKSYAVCQLVGLGQLNLRPNLVSINSAPIFLEQSAAITVSVCLDKLMKITNFNHQAKSSTGSNKN